MSEPILGVRDLVMRFGDETALEVDDFSIQRGETITLVGHNGSGKSTLMRILALLLAPTEGGVWFDGQPVDFRSRSTLALRRRMAGVHQEPLLCRMSVFNNVALGLRFCGVSGREIGKRVDPWLDRFHIAHLRDRPARAISGGEAQRVSLARALVLDPDVLFLDEPFSGLDAPTRERLLADFQEILGETSVTTIFTTHDRNEALVMGDRMVVLEAGRIAQFGEPDEIYRRPASEGVARFVGVENRIPGTVVDFTDNRVRVDFGEAEVEARGSVAPGQSVLLCLRPEDVTLAAADTGAADAAVQTGGENVLVGTVVRILPSDSSIRVVVDCGFPVVALVTRAAYRELKLEPGDRARVSFFATDAHLIPQVSVPPAPTAARLRPGARRRVQAWWRGH